MRAVIATSAIACVLIAINVSAEPPKRPPLPPMPKDFRIHGDPKAGQQLYVANCALCHGKKGDGGGAVGQALPIPPASFTDAKRMGAISDWELFVAVSQGGAAVGLSPLMSPWASVLKEQEMHDVVAFVKTFWQPMTKAKAP